MSLLSQSITVSISLVPGPGALAALRALLKSYEDACDRVLEIATERQVRHQATLHSLVYRQICPRTPREGQLPSQYAVRAISRVSHQIRCEALKLGDPYPASSIDLDARSFSPDLANSAIKIASLKSVAVRGQNAKSNRLSIPARFPPDELDLWSHSVFTGGHILLDGDKPTLIARLRPDYVILDALRDALLQDFQGHA